MMISGKKTIGIAKNIEEPKYVEYDPKENEFDLKKIGIFYLFNLIFSSL